VNVCVVRGWVRPVLAGASDHMMVATSSLPAVWFREIVASALACSIEPCDEGEEAV
jgi:hypothetical protein